MLLGQVRRATKVSSGLRKASAFLVCLAPLFDMLCSLQCNCSCMNPFKKENLQLHEHEWKGRRKGPSIDSPFGQTVPVPSWVRKAPLELVRLVWFGVKLFPNITVNGACCFAPDSFAVLYCTVLWSYIIDHQQVNMVIIVQQLPYGLSNNPSLSFFFFLSLHPGVQANTNGKGSRVLYALPIPLGSNCHHNDWVFFFVEHAKVLCILILLSAKKHIGPDSG